jgi:hypothetical protein
MRGMASQEVIPMKFGLQYIAVALHAFLAVLVVGTMFRLLTYHALASPNPNIQHLGKAMSIQY